MPQPQIVKFTFNYYDYRDDSDARGWLKFESERQLDSSDSVRAAALSVINEALKNRASVWKSEVDGDSAIQIYLASKDVSDIGEGFKKFGFGLNYALDSKGGLIILNDYAPLHYNFKYFEIQELLANDYIQGDPKHIIIGLPDGLGATAMDLFDWFGFFSDALGISMVSYKVIDWIAHPIRHYKVRRIAQKWEENGIRYPSQLRKFIDTKAEWKLEEVKKRLKLNEEYAVKLIVSLGLEPIGNSWRLTHSKKSISNREKWLRNEKRYLKNIHKDGSTQ